MPRSARPLPRAPEQLGIKQRGGGGSGHDSDSSWSSTPQRSVRIKAAPGGSDGTGSGDGGAELVQAQATIAALREELALARAQADGATQQLHAAERHTQQLEVGGEG